MIQFDRSEWFHRFDRVVRTSLSQGRIRIIVVQFHLHSTFGQFLVRRSSETDLDERDTLTNRNERRNSLTKYLPGDDVD